MSIPLHSCFYDRPPRRSRRVELLEMPARSARCFPSFCYWQDRIVSQVDPAVQLESTMSSEDSVIGVVNFTLRPFEAAACIAIANHFFFKNFEYANYTGAFESAGSHYAAQRLLFDRLPFKQVHEYGTESPFFSRISDHSSQDIHSCMEQIASSLKDALVDYWITKTDEVRLITGWEEEYIKTMQSAMYVVRSRIHRLPRLGGGQQLSPVPLYVPLLDEVNHAEVGEANCAAVIALEQRSVVVRALRDMRAGEEVLLDYSGTGLIGSAADDDNPHRVEGRESHYDLLTEGTDLRRVDSMLGWEARYLMRAHEHDAQHPTDHLIHEVLHRDHLP